MDNAVFRTTGRAKRIMTAHNILITGSDSDSLFTASQILEKNGYKTTMIPNGGSSVEFLNTGGFALALIDYSQGDTDVPSKLQTVRNVSPETMIVLQGTPKDASSITTMYNSGADDCISKPYQPEELLFRVGKNIKTYELIKAASKRKEIISNCCICKKVRTDDYGPAKDKWMEVEDFLKEEMDILLSSTYCPECAQTVQEDLMVQLDRLKASKVGR
jgi:CheY-like chemotaxis protein